MMKQSTLTILILLMTITTYCQIEKTKSAFNFDFEKAEKGIPLYWDNFGNSNYTASLDSINVRNGKYSACITFNEGKPGFKAWIFTIPDNYNGKKITLSGYIKTENVSDGYAGLWLSINPYIASNNMEKNGIKGTTDWKKYEITLNMNPEKTKQIVLGGLLVGKGKMWLDDLKITIDGKDIEELKPIESKIFPAEKDKEFDNGSRITDIPLNDKNIDNLKTLGLVWGFLKYYHPSIAKGNYNWDYELFRILPKVLNSKNANDRDTVLVTWINQLGQFDTSKRIHTKSSEIKIEPDLGWIGNSNFSSELSHLLLKIKNASRTSDHFYVDLIKGVENPNFKNENPYPLIKYPDVGYRLLALYRYWNIIQYYFPYKNIIGEDWKKVLKEFIPQFIDAHYETEYTLAVLKLIARVHDSHAIILNNPVLNKYFGLGIAAIELSFVENKAVVTGFHNDSLGKETGLEIGDIVSKINNQPVESIVRNKLKITPASNYPTQLRDISVNLLRTNDTIINIEFIREGKKGNKTIKTYSAGEITIRYRFETRDTCFKFINKEIAYINNGSLKRAYLPKIWDQIQNTKGLIIDMRNYPTDFPIQELGRYLMPGNRPFAKFTNGSIETPGLFTYTKSMNVGQEKNNNYYKGKVVILINEVSQSSAEFHTMAYRVHPNAIVIGSTTAGADGNVSYFDLPGGINTRISGTGVYYPDGRGTQRIGIIPDIEIKPTVAGIKNRQDELVEKAIKIINEQ